MLVTSLSLSLDVWVRVWVREIFFRRGFDRSWEGYKGLFRREAAAGTSSLMVFQLLSRVLDAAAKDDAALTQWFATFAEPPPPSMEDMYNKWNRCLVLSRVIFQMFLPGFACTLVHKFRSTVWFQLPASTKHACMFLLYIPFSELVEEPPQLKKFACMSANCAKIIALPWNAQCASARKGTSPFMPTINSLTGMASQGFRMLGFNFPVPDSSPRYVRTELRRGTVPRWWHRARDRLALLGVMVHQVPHIECNLVHPSREIRPFSHHHVSVAAFFNCNVVSLRHDMSSVLREIQPLQLQQCHLSL